MKDKRDNHITRMIQICLDLANAADEGCDEHRYWDEVNLGCHALSNHLRKGVKAVINLQQDYYVALSYRNFAKRDREDMQEFLNDVFGDRDVYTLNDDHKRRLKEFIRRIDEETVAYE